MIYLHKILPLLISPLFVIIILVLWGLLVGSKKISLTGIAILIICSLPIFSGRLVAYLEKDYKLSSTESFQTADAIVVLSGMVRTIQSKNGIAYEWGEASDRIFAGIDLFKKKKAPYLILTSDKPIILLVTSAFHMPRAQKVFEAAGIRVLPFPVDFLSNADTLTFMSFIPSADALSQTSFFVREMIGRTYYSLKY